MFGRHLHDQAASGPHLPMQKADRVLLIIVRAEGVRAYQLGQPVGVVGIGALHAAHLV